MPRFKVAEADEGQRADVFVARKLKHFSRSSLKSLFDKKLVKITNKALKPSHRVIKGEVIDIDTSLLTAAAKPVNIPVVYEDDDVIVMDKPAGMLVHSKGALNTEATVASYLKTKITDKSLSGNRAGIVHRLDRATSGLIIGAKHKKALSWFQKQFSKRLVDKTYLAIVKGIPKPMSALIDAPIGRHPKNPQTFRINATGKSAQTKYHLLKQYQINGHDYCLLEIKPLTGRTHQIRVHMAYIGCPIAGDSLYGRDDTIPLLLHASELGIKLPDEKRRVFRAKSPLAINRLK